MRPSWLLLVAVLGSVVAAYPIMGNYFALDDFGSFYEIANFGPWDFIGETAAGHMLLVRNSVVYLWFLLFGPDAAWCFAFMLAMHVVNVVLLFLLLRRLTGSAYLACFGSLLFGVSPMNPGTLGWYAVSGHALAATFVLAALLLIVPHDQDGSQPLRPGTAAGASLCMLAASQSFGTGAACALVFPLVALLLRPSLLRNRTSALIVALVPLIVTGAMFALYGPARRLNPLPLTPSQISMATISNIWNPAVVHMFGHITALGVSSLVTGPAYALIGYPQGAVPILAVLGGCVAWVFVRGTPASRRAVLAFLVLAVACYASIALGRGPAFSVLRPTSLLQAYIAASRYHYLAQVALALVVTLVLGEIARRLTWTSTTKRVVLGVWGVWTVTGTVLLRPPMDHFDRQRAEVARTDESTLRRVRAQPAGAIVCIPNERTAVSNNLPGSVGIFLMLHADNELEGRHVRFVTSDPTLLARRADGGRLAHVLVPPSECSP
jgi:hypothetical protein